MNLEIQSQRSMRKSASFLGPVPASHNDLLRKLLDEVRTYHHNDAVPWAKRGGSVEVSLLKSDLLDTCSG
jgi:hypothetical protein